MTQPYFVTCAQIRTQVLNDSAKYFEWHRNLGRLQAWDSFEQFQFEVRLLLSQGLKYNRVSREYELAGRKCDLVFHHFYDKNHSNNNICSPMCADPLALAFGKMFPGLVLLEVNNKR